MVYTCLQTNPPRDTGISERPSGYAHLDLPLRHGHLTSLAARPGSAMAMAYSPGGLSPTGLAVASFPK